MNNTKETVFTFYRYPSVHITYFFAAVLVLELFFLVFHTFYQAKKKLVFARGAIVSQVIYFCVYLTAIFCTYIQQGDRVIGNTVFALEFIIFINDILFTTMRSAWFTSNKVIMREKYHKALLIYNITSLISIPALAAIAYLTYDRDSRTKTYYLAVITILGYYINQIINISVFLSLTRSLSSIDDKHQSNELQRMKIYTTNLVLSGIISKGYLLGINLVEDDFIFLWSQTIFDGNLLCIYFVLSSWQKFVRKIRNVKSEGSSYTTEPKGTVQDRVSSEITRNSVESSSNNVNGEIEVKLSELESN